MKRLHLWIGALALLAFFGTGLAMTLQVPALDSRPELERALSRSRHIYLLSAALINLLVGIYIKDAAPGTRALQRTGSVLLLMAPALALLGFSHDPTSSTVTEASVGKYGIYALFGGTGLHVIAALPWTRARG